MPNTDTLPSQSKFPGWSVPGNPLAPAAAPASTQATPQIPAQGSSSYNPFGNSPMVPQVQTSITPTAVYTPDQTQQSVNQQVAQLSAQNNLRQLLHGTDTPGISRSAGSLQGVLPQIAQSRGQAAAIMQGQPFSDAQTNMTQMLQGQEAQGNEWLGLAGAATQQNQNAIMNQYDNTGFLLQLLSGLGAFST